MNVPSSPLRTSSQTAANSDRNPASEPGTRLGGRALTFARAAWVMVTVLTVGLTVAGLPAHYEQLVSPCPTASCANEQLPRQDVQALEGSGLSLASYAVYDLGARSSLSPCGSR